jgi:hypothetical protein
MALSHKRIKPAASDVNRLLGRKIKGDRFPLKSQLKNQVFLELVKFEEYSRN